MTLGTRIKAAREYANMSQQTLADKLSISRPRIAEWEADKHEPAASRIKEIADATGVTVNFLLGDFPRMPTTWSPLFVIQTADDTPKTAEEACRLIRSETDMDYELSYVKDDIKVGWITFESGALVVWQDGDRDPDADMLYNMLVR